MEEIYTVSFRVPSTDVDASNQLRPSAVLSWFQQFGTEHASILKIDRDYLVENYHACWILARVWYHLERPVSEGEQITLKTWCRGAGDLIIYRDYDLFCGDEKIGEGVAAWVIADLENRNMLRPSLIRNLALYEVPDCIKTKQLRLIRSPKLKAELFQRQIRYSDLDINGHMNNVKYADVIMDAFQPEELKESYIEEFQLNYSEECKFGEAIQLSRAMTNGGWYVDGCCDSGKRRFEAIVKLAQIS